MELMGLVFGIFGAALITTGDFIIHKIKIRKYKYKLNS
jgi:hypothetical protein